MATQFDDPNFVKKIFHEGTNGGHLILGEDIVATPNSGIIPQTSGTKITATSPNNISKSTLLSVQQSVINRKKD